MKTSLINKNVVDASPNSTYIEKKNRLILYQQFTKHASNNNFNSMLSLFSNRQHLQRILFMNELYEKTLDIEGHIFEFGCKWGSNLSLFTGFRGMYQPYHHNNTFIY